MSDSPMTDSHKRALVVAYYLSRFDRKGIRALGFSSATEAFNVIGEKLGVKPSTVKNMRDSFEPYCSHVRVGWYQRKILRSRANVIEAYDELSEAAMAAIVQRLLHDVTEEANIYTAPISETLMETELETDDSNAYALRLRSGEKAEEFFLQQFSLLSAFAGSRLEDTRKLGIGFDFRAVLPHSYSAIEVKGVTAPHGSISFTDKEWSVAHILGDNYILALVRSLNDAPTLDLIHNPAERIDVKMRTIESVAVCWNAKV